MKFRLSLFSIILFISCQKNEEFNLTTNPLENLVWLKEIKTSFELSASPSKKQIIQYTYNEEPVFLIDSCIGCPDNLVNIYNLNGEVICQFGGIAGIDTCPDFLDNTTNKTILWQNSVIIDGNLYSNTTTNNYTITTVSIIENLLKIRIRSSGCSGDSWKATLIDANQILESLPGQRLLKLSLENNEECDAIFERNFVFDLTPLQIIDASQLILNLSKWNTPLNYTY